MMVAGIRLWGEYPTSLQHMVSAGSHLREKPTNLTLTLGVQVIHPQCRLSNLTPTSDGGGYSPVRGISNLTSLFGVSGQTPEEKKPSNLTLTLGGRGQSPTMSAIKPYSDIWWVAGIRLWAEYQTSLQHIVSGQSPGRKPNKPHSDIRC